VLNGLDQLRTRETVSALRGIELERTEVEIAVERGMVFLGKPSDASDEADDENTDSDAEAPVSAES
jgi:hypothetical protein